MTNEPTLSPYDEGTDPETESFLQDAQNVTAAGDEVEAPTEAQADGVLPGSAPSPEASPTSAPEGSSTPAEASAAESPTIAVERPTMMDMPLETASPTDTIVRRTSLFHPDEADDAAAVPVPVPAPAPFPVSEYDVNDELPSRAGAHWWSFLAVLILTPVAWYLLADAGARLTLANGNPWDTGVLNYAALGELAAGLVVLVVAILALRGSSLGAWITGPILLIGGATFLAIPQQVQNFLAPYLETLSNYNAFGGNLSHHLTASGSTGQFVIWGVALMAIGIVSHGARKSGKRRQRIEDALARRGV